jgi:ligand-binding sensor domain-containing protein/signal transduction histidine kinase
MLRSVNNNPGCVVYKVIAIAFILLTASCSGSATLTIDHATPENASTISAEKETDWPTSDPQLTPGQHLIFERIPTEQDLSQTTVICMLQDDQGFMWFGTEDGLNRYDGYNFKVYKHDPDDSYSLSDSWILAMVKDRSGVLWIGTANGGLNRFDLEAKQITRYQNDPDDIHSISNNRVLSVFEDQSGELWVGTEKGLNRFVRGSETFTHYQKDTNDHLSLSGDRVQAIYQDQDGNLWIGTDEGLNRYNSDIEGFAHFQNDPNNTKSLSHNSVRAIYQDSEGSLWIGTDDGLNRLDPGSERFIQYKTGANNSPGLNSNEVLSIFEDQSGVLWIGTYGGGLNYFDHKSETFVNFHQDPFDPFSLSNNFIKSIYQDREGTLWIGTVSGNLNKLDLDNRVFVHYQNDPNNPNSLSNNWVRKFFEDQSGAIWISTGDGGLDRFDPKSERFTHYVHDPDDPNSLSHNNVSHVIQDSLGMLWIGTRTGIDQLDPTTGIFSHYQHDPDDPTSLSENNFVWFIIEDDNGMLWFATNGGGLNRFNRETETFTRYLHDSNDSKSLIHNDVWEIALRQDGRLWIGTGGGLDLFDPETGKFAHYQNDPENSNSLSINFVGPILETQNGVTWFGTIGGGLDKFDRASGTFTHFREKDGLPSDFIEEFLEDSQGNFWIITSNGLSKFDPQTEIFQNFDEMNGLPFLGFNGGALIRSSSGRLYAGGSEGFLAFHPDQVHDNPYIPPVVITAITQGGEEILLKKTKANLHGITFEWPNNSFEFEYAALSFSNPNENQYAYYLEGFEDTWTEVGTRRYGQYTNLPGGNYTLRVKGSNDDGVWNEAGALVQVIIVPPFWQTWWFLGILILVLAGSVFGGYRLRVRNLEMRGRDLESQVEQRTAELMRIEETLKRSEMEEAVAAERNRLARDLHDAVTQTLFSASLIAETLPRSWERDQDKGRRLLKELRQLSRGASAEMRTLLLELRPAAMIETNLSDLLHQLAEAASGRGGVPVNVTVEGECALSSEVHIALYRIAQEALNNAIKHARAGQVKVHLRSTPFPSKETASRQREKVELVVRDDGRGFNPNDVSPDHLGLVIMHERAEAIGATLEIESGHRSGTQIKVMWKEEE